MWGADRVNDVLGAVVASKAIKVEVILGASVCNKVDVLETIVVDNAISEAVASGADKFDVPGVVVSGGVRVDVVPEGVVALESGRICVVLGDISVRGCDRVDVVLEAVVRGTG